MFKLTLNWVSINACQFDLQTCSIWNNMDVRKVHNLNFFIWEWYIILLINIYPLFDLECMRRVRDKGKVYSVSDLWQFVLLMPPTPSVIFVTCTKRVNKKAFVHLQMGVQNTFWIWKQKSHILGSFLSVHTLLKPKEPLLGY